jgi:TRAP-type mannitol/chloroaromatic compound transport system permease large subunit
MLSFLAMMGSGIPVAIAMAGASLIYVMVSGSIPDYVVIHRMVNGIDSFPLLAVPFFIMAGNLMNSAGITNRIYNFALALVGWLKGGLGHVNVIGSVIFAGMSGTAIADAAGLGTIEIKAMQDHGYSTGVGHARAHHSAFAAVRDLRHVRQCLGGGAVSRRHPARRAHGAADDADRDLLCAQERLGARH